MNADANAPLDDRTTGRLHALFLSLSLDMAAAALEGLGVPPEHVPAVRDAIRSGLGTGDPGALSLEDEATAVRTILAALDSILGPRKAAETKQNLVDAFFDADNDTQMFLWEQIIRFGGPRSPDDDASTATLPELVKRVRAAWSGGELRSVRVPETDYDRALLMRLGEPEPDETNDDPRRGPLPELDNAVDRIGFLRAFRRALAAAEDPEAELDTLVQWGGSAAGDIGMPAEMLERPRFLARPEWPPSA